MVEALTVERARELFAGLLPAPGPVRAVSRFAEGSVTGAYRVEFAGADPASAVLKIYDAGNLRFAVKEARALRFLTGHGLDVSPRVLHAGGPLMDFVRLDAFSVHGDATKMAGLFSGYGVSVPGQRTPGRGCRGALASLEAAARSR